MSDAVLIIWFVFSCLWDFAIWGFWGYLVFWRGHSGWWALLAIALTYSPALYKALNKRFGIEESE